MTVTTSSPSQFTITWELAVKRYAAAVGKQRLDDASLPRPSSIAELLHRLDTQNSDFARFRETKHSLFHVLTSLCEPIERFGSLAADIASSAFAPSCVCFSAIAYLIDAAKDVSASYDAVVGLFVTLNDFLVRLAVYDGTRMSEALQAKVVDILATLLEIFGQATKIVRGGISGRVLRFTKNALLGSDKTLQGLISRLDRLCQTEHQLVGAETLVESKKTSQAVESLAAVLNGASLVLDDSHGRLTQAQADLQRLAEGQDELRQEVHRDISSLLGSFMGSGARRSSDSDHLKSILQPSVAPSDMYYDFARKRLPGTGEWIHSEPGFRAWLEREQPLLWISGQPGCGKSFLAEYIISELKRRYPQGVDHESQTSIGYFFFKDNSPKTRDVHQALRDVAYQVSLNDPVYAREMALQCSSAGDIGTLQSAWMTLFRDYFVGGDEGGPWVYVVLDGLDESLEADRQMFLEFLLDVKGESSVKPRIQIVMLGRPHLSGDVVDLFHESVSSISIDRSKNDDDIARYVERSVMRSRNLARAPQSLRREVVEFLTKNAQGMFMWVNLMVQELGRHNRASSIRECLTRPPTGLYETIRRTLESLSAYLKGDDPTELNTALTWVTCAARPLSLQELEAALVVESSEPDDILNLESMLRLQFASFLTLVRDDGLTTSDLEAEAASSPVGSDDALDEDADDLRLEGDFNSNPKTTEVVFCHASIGDFFRDENESKCSAGEACFPIGVDIVEARISTLKICLQLMCNPSKGPNIRKYALIWWYSHVEAAVPHLDRISPADRLEIGRLILQSLRDERILAAWISLREADSFWSLETMRPIVKLLDDGPFLDALDVETRDWVLAAIEKPQQLFIPAANLFAKRWLQDMDWRPRVCMLIINRIRGLLDGTGEGTDESPSASDVLDSAEWAELPKTAEWHRRVAMCLRRLSFFEEAKAHFQAALEVDSEMWLARSGLAYMYSLSGDHEKSLDLYRENGEVVEAALENVEIRDKLSHSVSAMDLADIYKDVGQEAVALGDNDTAMVYFEKALALDAQCECSTTYIEILGARDTPEDNEKIMQYLHGLEKSPMSSGHTRLTEWLTQRSDAAYTGRLYMSIAWAARSTHQLEWLESTYTTAISLAKRQRDSALAFALQVTLADLFISYDTNKEALAVSIWQMVMDFPATFMQGNTFMLYLQTLVSRSYGSYLLAKALHSDPSPPTPTEANPYILTLQRIAQRRVLHLDHVSSWAANNFATALLGVWYHRTNQPGLARACCLPFAKQFVAHSDDSRLASYLAYYAFAKILLLLSDESRAIALLHGAGQVEGVAWTCEARCGLQPKTWTGANICLDCAADLCDGCLGGVRDEGPLKANICSKEHSWVKIPGVDEGVVVEEGELFVDGVVVSSGAFIAGIRTEWGLS
ncbi:hypothetical protein BO70DRAFT_423185 [Aspergillus heteromorphus CBS 117.55]|uniref:NACHT and TPR domain protein n=1 Tax=Aspergillus heteromorphus CBS 117.55 TaxID=1448321 RepID=A0A317WI95_9EURO|nr:uncharacterized protein BO70DRAFT_423185 [Aspergillus heteromorphus CBS 117.55]PWY86019.1 hypothetical protein BO70DRAFT_423185 [Aspergillus heteromorphus CBS 117.55]